MERDWPDCYRINRYVKNYPDAPEEIKKILLNFNRWPTWTWANWEIAALAEWIRNYNGILPVASRIGFYGLDVYSLPESMYEMMKYLDVEDPLAAKAVKQAIFCFDHSSTMNNNMPGLPAGHSCRDKVMALLTGDLQQGPIYGRRQGSWFQYRTECVHYGERRTILSEHDTVR